MKKLKLLSSILGIIIETAKPPVPDSQSIGGLCSPYQVKGISLIMHLITEDDKAPLFNVPLNLEYNFDYARFNELSLQNTAKATLGSFFGFVRQSFDSLLSVGQSLQNFYFDCLSKCPDGKKIFEEWLKSDDWGSSRYLATSAMEIWGWFEKLSPKIQRLVRQNVQKWSVSALRQLTKVSTDLVKELVRTGKKTAQQVKKSVGGGERESVGVSVKETREVENSESTLTSSHSPTSPLSHPATSKQEYFTAAEVEEKIAQALAQRDREKAEEEQGRFIEIRDAALEAAKRELIAAEQHAQKMTQAKQAKILATSG